MIKKEVTFLLNEEVSAMGKAEERAFQAGETAKCKDPRRAKQLAISQTQKGGQCAGA